MTDERVAGTASGGGGGSTGDTTWTPVTYVNGWADNTFAAGFRKDGQGFVHLRGLMDSGSTNSVAFNLPAGYRPGQNARFACGDISGSSGALGGVVYIQTTGDAKAYFGSTARISLDGITFLAEG